MGVIDSHSDLWVRIAYDVSPEQRLAIIKKLADELDADRRCIVNAVMNYGTSFVPIRKIHQRLVATQRAHINAMPF